MPKFVNGFEVYKDKRGEYRWRRTGPDGKIVGRSCEGYGKRADAEANMNRGNNSKDRWEFYTDRRGEHRWRCVAQNGALIGASPAGYKSKKDAQANAALNGWKA
jgi:uncharacterized protein YegP (UPF0339 family)